MIALGPFAVESPIGRGGMGCVWGGTHASQGVPVAVKVVTAGGARDPYYLSFFRNEVRAVAGLNHPNVVLVLDHGLIPSAAEDASAGELVAGSPYLVMERASLGALSRCAPPRTWVELRLLLLDLLDALAHAHARGVVHRDLKPGNVLVCGPGDARPGLKLADFGLARPPESVAEGHATGTPAYMAPEQATGSWREQGPWTDLYALGCLVFKVCSGLPPFRGRTHHDVVESHLRRPVPQLHSRVPLPPGFEAWVGRLLEKDPAARFRRAADAAWALRKLGDAPVPSAPDWSLREGEQEMPTLSHAGPHTLLWPELFGSPAARPSADEDALAEEPTVDAGDSTVPEEDIATVHAPAGGFLPVVAATVREAIIATTDAPAVPPSWHRRDPAPVSMRLLGAGLGLYGLRPIPLVDRDSERDVLWGALRQVAAEGRARLVILQGPSGCGKSRLAEWLGERAHELGCASVLRATHGPIAAAADGLAPMLGRALACRGLARRDAADRVRTELRARGIDDQLDHCSVLELVAPTIEDATPEEGERVVRFRNAAERYTAAERLLGWIATERPVVVVLDDAQWALDALGFAAHLMDQQHEAPCPLLLVCTVRTEALSDRSAERDALEALAGRPGAQRLHVGPLPQSHRAALVRELLGLAGDVAVEVERRTAGNPLFAVQLVGDWVHRGLLEPGESGFRLRRGATVQLPDDIHQVWAARIDRVLEGRPDEEALALELAAVLGLEVDAREWSDVCAKEGDVEMPMLLVERLLEQRLATCPPGGPALGWAFVHGMLRESLERRARDAGRWRDHHRACAAMLRRRRDIGTAERLGRHLVACGDWEEALEPLVTAVAERSVAGDHRLAEALYAEWEQAIEQLSPPEEDPRWCSGWAHRGALARFSGDYDLAHQLLEKAVAGARAADAPAVLAMALGDLGEVTRLLGRPDEAWSLLREAEALATEQGDRGRRGKVTLRIGLILIDRGERRRADAMLREARANCLAAGDETAAAICLLARAGIPFREGHITEAKGMMEEALVGYQRSGFRLGEADCLSGLGEAARFAGDLDTAEARYLEALAIYRHLGSEHVTWSESKLALVALERGKHDVARPVLEATARHFEEQGNESYAGSFLCCLLPALAAAGDWQRWDEVFTRATELLTRSGYLYGDVARMAEITAVMARDAGWHDRARRAYELAQRQWHGLAQGDQAERVGAILEALSS